MSGDLSARTPPDIDTELAELHRKMRRAQGSVSFAFDEIHRALGERSHKVGKAREWSTTGPEAETALRSRLATGDDVFRGQEALARLDGARAELAAVRAAMAPLDTEYARRPWSRFFLVDANNGHIHRTMRCATCYPSTRFGWLPELSGLTEADAVAAQGPLLCTVCFPSAPLEWTAGRPKQPRCAGTGRCPLNTPESNVTRHGMRIYANCPECGLRGTLTPNGRVRAHQPPTDGNAKSKVVK